MAAAIVLNMYSYKREMTNVCLTCLVVYTLLGHIHSVTSLEGQ